MSSPSFTRAERTLNKWASDPKVELSDAGKDWLITAIDPFHDTLLHNLAGWPDVSTSASVIQCVKQSIQISATSGGASAPTGPWDCHLAMFPHLSNQVFEAVTQRSNNVISIPFPVAPYITPPIGGLTAVRTDPGANANWMPIVPSAKLNVLGTCTLDPTYQTGVTRVIGVGFEVYDTTAEISRQGSCTVYRQPEPERIDEHFTGYGTSASATDLNQVDFAGTLLRLPPVNTKDAMLLAGTRQWKSSEGCYCVGAFHSNQNPPLQTNYVQPVYQGASIEDSMEPTANNTNDVWMPVSNPASFSITISGVTYKKWTVPPSKIHPFHQFGAIFSGLNPTSTLTVNVNYFVEQFPSVANKQLTVLAKPSCRFDPMALEIYSRALSCMPVGVPVKENGLGTWFANLVKEVEPFVTPIAKMIHPALGAISGGAGIASRAYLKDKPVSKQTYVTAPSGNLAVGQKKRKKVQTRNNKLSAGNRGKKGNIQGPLRQ